MKIYIAGKITGLDDYKKRFKEAQDELQELGHTVMNPAMFEEGFTHEEYMHVCYAMIDVCEGVYFLNNWRYSKGAKLEHEYAVENGKWIKYQKEGIYI